MSFRSRLLATLRAIEPVLEEPGVLVVGSEVPNLLQEDAASTLVISDDVDIGVPVASHEAVKRKLSRVESLQPSKDEPSVWVSEDAQLTEVNFVGMDQAIGDASETYVLEDDVLPLLVFGPLSLLRPGAPVDVEGLRVPVPAVAGLLLEKLATDRSGVKGDRDLLVALGLILVATQEDLDEVRANYPRIPPEMQYTVRTNLTVLSLLEPVAGMPDPRPHRGRIALLLKTLEGAADPE